MAQPGENSAYMLSHVHTRSTEFQRLDEQYFVFRDNVLDGKCLHSSIPESCLSAHGTIADLGTGTGIYLNDVASQHPETKHCVGFDPNAAAFMKQLEPGVELLEHDCTKPFDERWKGYFDVVNIRVLAYALTAEQWQALIKNACHILRPGGYLQWVESETQNISDTNSTPEFAKAMELIMVERRERGLVEFLPDFMLQTILSTTSLESEFFCLLSMLAASSTTTSSVSNQAKARFSEVSHRALSALLQSRGHRKRFLAGSEIEQGVKRQLEEEAQIADEVHSAFEAKKGEMELGIRFPLLVARKRGGGKVGVEGR